MHSADNASLQVKQVTKEAALHDGFLILDELSFSEPTELRYYQQGVCIASVQYRLTEAGKSLTIAAECGIRIASPIDVSDLSLSSKEETRFESSVRVSEKCQIRADALRCLGATIHMTGDISIRTHSLSLSKKSDLRLEGSEKEAELIAGDDLRVSATSRLMLTKMQCKTKKCDVKGSVYCQDSQFVAKKLSQSGLIGLKQSTLLSRRYDQASSAKSVLSSSAIRANHISLKGIFQAKRSHLRGDTFLLSQGSFLLQKQSSLFCSKGIVMLAGATCSVSHSELVCLNDDTKTPCSIDIQSSGTFKKASVQTDVMSVKAKQLSIVQSNIQTNRSCLIEDYFTIDSSSLVSPKIRFSGNGTIESTKLRGEELVLQVNGRVSNTKMRCNRLELQGEDLTILKTRMVFSKLSVSGKVQVTSGSELTGIGDQNNYHEIHGNLTLEESSLQCAGKIYSSPESEVRLLSSDVVAPAWVCESSLLVAKSGTLLTESLLKSGGEIQAESYVLSASGDAILSGVRAILCKHSTLKASNVYVSNGAQLDCNRGHVVAQNHFYTTEGTSLTVRKTTVESESAILAGQYTAVGCQLASNKMDIMGEASIRKSAFFIEERLDFSLDSDVFIEGSVVDWTLDKKHRESQAALYNIKPAHASVSN